MTEFAALLLAYASCVALALTQNQHQRQAFRQKPGDRTGAILRWLGSAGLLSCYFGSCAGRSWSTALVLWTGIFTVGALFAALTLTYRAPLAVRSLTVSGLVGTALLVASVAGAPGLGA